MKGDAAGNETVRQIGSFGMLMISDECSRPLAHACVKEVILCGMYVSRTSILYM